MIETVAILDPITRGTAIAILGCKDEKFKHLVGSGQIKNVIRQGRSGSLYSRSEILALRGTVAPVAAGKIDMRADAGNGARTWVHDFVNLTPGALKKIRPLLSRTEQAQFAEDLTAVREFYAYDQPYASAIPGAYWVNRGVAERWLRLIESRVTEEQNG